MDANISIAAMGQVELVVNNIHKAETLRWMRGKNPADVDANTTTVL